MKASWIITVTFFLFSCKDSEKKESTKNDQSEIENSSIDTTKKSSSPQILTSEMYKVVSSLSNDYVKTYGIRLKANDSIRTSTNVDSVILNPFNEEIKPKPLIILYEDEERRGSWSRSYDVKRNMSNIEPTSQASSLEIRTEGWVTFYSRSHYAGSELYVRGPFYIPELRKITKINRPGLSGNWSDEIASFKFEPARPAGKDGENGTYVNDDEKSPPPSNPPFPCKNGYLYGNVYGYNIFKSADGYTYFRIYDDQGTGCTRDLGKIKTSDITSTAPWIGSCTLGSSYQIYTIRFCYEKQ